MAQRIPCSTTVFTFGDGVHLGIFPLEIREMNLGFRPNVRVCWDQVLEQSNEIVRDFEGYRE